MKTTISINKFGPWALITGASSGIGKEFAHQLASNKINLVLTARRQNLLEELGNELHSKYGIKYRIIVADLSQESSIDHLINESDQLDIGLVVSNAGTGKPGDFVEKKMDDLKKMLNTSVLAHLKITHHFAIKFSQLKRGGIILVSAMGAKNGLPFMSHDAGTRAYIRSLGLGLNYELARYKVNMTVVETTPTDTPIVSDLGFNADKMPIKPITVQQCVQESLNAFKKNKPVVIPGLKFRAMMKLLPASLVRKMNAKMLAEGNGIDLIK